MQGSEQTSTQRNHVYLPLPQSPPSQPRGKILPGVPSPSASPQTQPLERRLVFPWDPVVLWG